MSRLILAAAALALAVSLGGCASTKEYRVATVGIDTKPKLKVKDPKQVKLGKVEWIVVTKSNIDDLLKKKGVVAFYAVTPEGYKTLQTNQGQLLRLIGQQKSVVVALKRYYDEP